MSSPHIHYINGDKIDRKKWDDCISSADNGLIYGYSFYLDSMAKHWDGLVLNDYEAVMPLTWNKKYGILYLYQPFLCAQSGVFGRKINDELFKNFLSAIPQKFLYVDIYLNHQNLFLQVHPGMYERSNYVLNLEKPYDELYKNYRDNIRRNIEKAKKLDCAIRKNPDASDVIELAKAQMKNFTRVKDDDFDRALKLYQYLHRQNMAITYGVYSSKNELLASCIFFFSHNRAYYILVGNHPDGRTIGASHALIDAFIQDHAGEKLLLDFEGSDIRNLAFFYSSFGASEEKYAAIKLNRLPWYIRWIK